MSINVRPSIIRNYHIAALLLLISIITFGRNDQLIYLNIAICFLVPCVMLSFTLLTMKVSRLYAATLIGMTMWMWYELFITPTVMHAGVHINVTLLSLIYTLAAIGLLAYLTKDLFHFVRMMGLITIIWVCLGMCYLVLFHMGIISYGERDFSGMYYNRNQTAVVGCFLLCIWLTFLPELRRYYPLGIGTVLVPLSCIILIISTLSTKGLIGIGIVLLLYVFRFYMGKRRIVILGILSAVMIAVVLLAGGSALERVQNKWADLNNAADSNFEDTRGRIFLMVDSLRIIKENPLKGVGVYNSQYHLFTPRYWVLLQRGQIDDPNVGVYSHVNYLEMLLNGGIPAFFLYYSPLIILFGLVIKARKVSPFGRRIRNMLISLLSLKFFFDIGMVSFESFIHIFAVATCFIFYGKYLCKEATPNPTKEVVV